VKVHGFVQAGGGSTRFGQDKALVQLGAKTMLQRTCELLQSVCGDATIVAAGGRYGDAGWPLLMDRWPGQGPLGGILTALYAIDPSLESASLAAAGQRVFAIILSCDMPFLTSEFLRFLVDRARHSEAQVVVPERSRRLEPLCACWSAASLAGIQTAFDAGIRKVSEAMKRVPREVLDEPAWKRFDSDGRLFWNMNTAADYQQARHILESRKQ